MVKRQGGVLALVAFGLFAGAVLWAAHLLADAQGALAPQSLTTFIGVVLACALLLLVAVWGIIRRSLVKPMRRLAVETRAIVHSVNKPAIDTARYAMLPGLAEAVAELAERFDNVRRQVTDIVGEATASAQQEKNRLGAILNELHEGVVVCNLKHQVVLYNQVALRVLRLAGDIGLGRTLSSCVVMDPILHILEVLTHRTEGGPGSAPFITGTPDGRSLLQGRMSLVRGQAAITGYIMTFNDVTVSLSALARRDALLREVIERLRRPAQQLGMEGHDQAKLAMEVSNAFDRAVEGYRSLLASWWPMTDINTGYLFDFVIRRLDDAGLKVNLTGLPVWIHGDSHSLVLALDGLLRSIAKGTGAVEFDLSAETEGGLGWVCITWRGSRIDDASLIAWQKEMIISALGGMTVRDVMLHHTREDLIEEAREGLITLRLALPLGREGHDRAGAAEKLPPRPEFFDFDLLAQGQAVEQRHRSLRDLTYVVFDTETTGLHPTQGDAIVSIGGVRVVNGRILTGETFHRIVNPGRPIPAESVKFHGITDEMAADKPPLELVLPQFKAYAADEILVAHNAAFDLKFVRMREKACGVTFDNPVLDTMLLSSYIDGTPENQFLDAIAERYGIAVNAADRHTALGDALVTAAVLLKLIDALERKGIRTLEEAMSTLNMTVELHNRAQALM